jgi:hypothetical protein
MPVIALQLAVLTEKYRRAIESDCAGRAERAAENSAALLRDASQHALVIAPLWTDWGHLTVAHNELMKQLMRGAQPDAVRPALRRVTTLSNGFISRCVQWALFEQSRPSVPFHTADAFIAWEGARRSAWQLREQIETFLAESGSTEVPNALAEITAQAERNANRLLVQAMLFLEGSEGAAERSGD